MKYINEIEESFKSVANAEYATKMEAYLKNKFKFYGIKRPILKEVSKPFLRKENLPDFDTLIDITKKLWDKPQREYHYFALDLLDKYYKKWTDDYLELFEWMVVNKSWWDTVDIIATNKMGKYLLGNQNLIENYNYKWVNSNNMWLNRVAILFQLKYKNQTDLELLFSNIQQHKDSNEFFIQKAIGWALREYSKTNQKIVAEFVENEELKPLSSREALKIINKL